MEERKRPVALTVLAVLLGFTGIATAVFWIMFFTGKMKAAENEQDEAHERSFPLADSWMIAWACAAAVNILKQNRKGFFAGATAAGAMTFLGLMDVLYSLENGKYWPLDGDRVQMLIIHLWAVTLGVTSLKVLWKHRDSFYDEKAA